ncbi:uncharacterized protein LOC100906521 [Galendromus occidentalis]|uniref:Uncharacterized protein LOC100906521 n=1 Tax=Galendromus occidentalis TaxID=34638 RepID=A0AAJ6VZT3_9ACAR|nr:uncharacterized protein LOC100906521 [Galendromus occidentalis]
MRSPLFWFAVSIGLSLSARRGPKIIDLTHWWDSKTVFPPTNLKNFTMHTYFRKTLSGVIYQSETIELSTNGGTHMLSPAFLLKGRHTASQIPLDRLFLPTAVIDVSHHVMKDSNYQLRIVDIKRWEDIHGQLPQGGLLAVNTGWGKRFWGDTDKYFGTDKENRKEKNCNYPGVHPDAAQWLVSYRKLHAVGIDSPSLDHGLSKKFESQQILLSANIYLINNIDHIWALPPAGATTFVFPMKVKGAAVVPIRLMALSP